MKVHVSFTLDVDAEAWALAYGVDKSKIREDVKMYVAERTHEFIREQGFSSEGKGE